MLADAGRVRDRQVFQPDERLLLGSQIQQRTPEGELVAGHVPAEADDMPPVTGWGRGRVLKWQHVAILALPAGR
jgi:hypothetical protein